ncbi:hypothetical protein N7495_008056 [Penicillium taxi]|uniref:uncharacterized protein n=1 Tax=Penicillium taxi TaxID=168475 RepID=UPI0025452E96|nr:uncharacterized protein N7495_008056 [Penicillium taxi]KAJ5888015.1 hypothetical protein N7495_008056 [Penicillium taxi]
MNPSQTLQLRETDTSGTDKFLKLIASPFESEVSAFTVSAVWASLGTSVGVSVLFTLLFSLFRPHHTLVYAPKIKHADPKHTPPAVGKGIFSWIKPVIHTREPELLETIGLDATIFLRFTKMCRNIFIIMSIIGCAIMIPVNVIESRSNSFTESLSAFSTMTPLYVTSTTAIWSQVACAWVFDIIISFFLFRTYQAVRKMRRQYFQSSDYQRSMHARTLMITDIPPSDRSDEGILQITDEVNHTASLPRAAIGRNVRDLPKLIKEHEEHVRKLESVLAKYLKRPDQLPAKRPRMRPPRSYRKKNSDGKVDTIDFLTIRIRVLEEEIKHGRTSIDRRNAMPFGFASWENIEHAHSVAWNARRKHPMGTTVRLAPRPNDLIWENLPLSKPARKWKRFANFIWVTALTVVWIVPNALIAVFLSDFSHLGYVWEDFDNLIKAQPKVWAAIQGIASPAVTSLAYLVLPIIFRRLSIQGGSKTKTSRERHVLGQLYAFFVFNNLIVFSLFSAAWTFVSTVIDKKNDESTWKAMVDGQLYYKMISALCNVSPFWVTWLLQRNLGATIDLAQMITVAWVWFSKTFLSPTPRQAIEWTAPQPFDYATHYNYFLFYSTVAMCFATLQPIVLPITALYFGLDALLKKYLLLYVFVTKNESAGAYWRPLFNRMVFATILSNIIIAMVTKVKGTWTMVFCVIPLPFLMIGFKVYCSRVFDADIKYYRRGNLTDAEALAPGKPGFSKKAAEKLNAKFGHPALFKPLITPMVHARAAEVLKDIYAGRLESGEMAGEYSDIAMNPMLPNEPGKIDEAAPFEVVPENHLDFSYFKDRYEFQEEFGGGIYGRPEDLMTERSHTPRPTLGAEWSPTSSRASSPAPSHEGRQSPHPAFHTPLSQLYNADPVDESESRLLNHAQAPGQVESASPLDRWRSGGYGPVYQQDEETEDTSYDAYRQGNR